ncbi:MAG: histidine triad nucleotide-binding protein [Clostridia bacterium]|nr:histidine triad nucleotide-binding protein [Clostridia bacterium]
MDDCIFCKIIKKEIPSEIVYEDEQVIAFKDIHPVAPVHVLIIPKKHISAVTEIKEDDEAVIGKIYSVINTIAEKMGIKENGFRVIVNCGKDGGQEVKHLHFHLIGGKELGTKIVH